VDGHPLDQDRVARQGIRRAFIGPDDLAFDVLLLEVTLAGRTGPPVRTVGIEGTHAGT
jgi:hypothetical protein